MPYLSIRTSANMDGAQRLALQQELGELIAVIPGKSANNCMIDIKSGCDLYMRGGEILGAFVDLRLFTAAPDAAKNDFFAKLCVLLKEQLGVEQENIYCNMLELTQWCSGGALKKA